MPFDELAEFRDLIGELPSTMTEFTKSPTNAHSLNTDEGDVDSLFCKALDGIPIFAGAEIGDLLEQLVRSWFEDALQCRPPCS